MTPDPGLSAPPPSDSLPRTVTEIERHVADAGWDQPPLLYALVDTADLLSREPGLADLLGLSAPPPSGALTPVQQEGLDDGPLDDVLARIGWPDDVLGCAVAQEVLVLPRDDDDPPAGADPAEWAAEQPGRRDARLVVGVLRDGSTAGTLRVRGTGADPDDVLAAPDLAPNLAAALLATLEWRD